ncbi:mechanosensitive ion channel family protein [Nosocomiicoccus massiliensis]|uniref:Mechanosensitive ion channel family protein n=1 Tax=Nosocomiicoccus massiliensis TaxID=1232430 RepID=A0AAF0YL06_9STAP|nr:mechanosensitive ion channel family protein [Nosocomiicoccus massiliensis]WOS95684.1 mechanosensitive ion channel family protein [Nosocomiicoccus massiliensis]
MILNWLTLMAVEAIDTPLDTSFLDTIWKKITSVELWVNVGERVLWSIFIVILGMIIIKIVNRIIENFLLKKISLRPGKAQISLKRNKTLLSMLQNSVTVFGWFVIVVTILEIFNIPVGTLLAGAGIAGLAIGFGAQSLVKDMITGFFIILENQFDKGDFVKFTNQGSPIAEGQVVYLGLRSSKVLGYNSEMYMVPNGTIGEVVNFSKENSIAFLEFYLPIDTDISRIERLLSVYVEENWQKNESIVEPPQLLGVQDFISGQLQYRIMFITRPMEQFQVLRDYRKNIQTLLKNNEIILGVPSVEFNEEKK